MSNTYRSFHFACTEAAGLHQAPHTRAGRGQESEAGNHTGSVQNLESRARSSKAHWTTASAPPPACVSLAQLAPAVFALVCGRSGTRGL